MGTSRIQPLTPRWTQGGQSVVFALIMANIVAFLAQMLLSTVDAHLVDQWFALSSGGIRQGYLWQLVTYMFVHGDPAEPVSGMLQLLVNMLMLYFAGREVEAIAGSRHLLGMYFLGGLTGGLAQVLAAPHGGPVSGASAGVCAVLIAFTTILPEIKVVRTVFSVIPIRLQARQVAWLVVGSSALFAVLGLLPAVVDLSYFSPVTHFAHIADLGGCVVGWIYAKQLGFGRTWRIQRYFFERRQREERLARMPSAQFIQEEIDPILDKICREGLRSLTRAERKILERGREKIEGKLVSSSRR